MLNVLITDIKFLNCLETCSIQIIAWKGYKFCNARICQFMIPVKNQVKNKAKEDLYETLKREVLENQVDSKII